jgi:hypothetical protein
MRKNHDRIVLQILTVVHLFNALTTKNYGFLNAISLSACVYLHVNEPR